MHERHGKAMTRCGHRRSLGGVRYAVALILLLACSGCLTAKKGSPPLIDFGNSMVQFSTSMQFFQDSGNFAKDGDEYSLTRVSRDQFVLKELSSSKPDEEMQVKFRLIKNDFYIGQIRVEDETLYLLLYLFDGGVRIYTGYDDVGNADGELRALAGLKAEQKSGSNIDNERDLFKFFEYVAEHTDKPYLDTQTFLSFNMENASDVALLNQRKQRVAEAKTNASTQ